MDRPKTVLIEQIFVWILYMFNISIPDPAISLKRNQRLSEIKQRVAHMNQQVIDEIYQRLTKPVKSIEVCTIYVAYSRRVIYVKSLTFTDGTKVAVNQFFYSSLGQSRGLPELNGHWFPGGQLDPLSGRNLIKLESTYFSQIYGMIGSPPTGPVMINGRDLITENTHEIFFS